jgi:hypothetical protein
MSTKKRDVIWGGRIMGAEMRAQSARKAAQKAVREADRAEAKPGLCAWKATAGPRSRRLRSGNA